MLHVSSLSRQSEDGSALRCLIRMRIVSFHLSFFSYLTRISEYKSSQFLFFFLWDSFRKNLKYSMTAKEMYFAFGSNMNPDRMRDRKAFFTDRVGAKLSDYKMSFSFRRPDGGGSCNIRPEENSVVYGALYTLEAGGLNKLDVFELVSQGCYRRELVTVETSEGDKVEATAYVVTDQFYQEGLVPPIDYLEHCLAGKDVLPAEYYDFLESFKKVCKY